MNEVIVTTDELNKLSGLNATKDELNKLSGLIATTNELNKLNGLTSSTIELNYSSGLTGNIQDQIDLINEKIGEISSVLDAINGEVI